MGLTYFYKKYITEESVNADEVGLTTEETMRKIFALSIGLLLLPALVFADTNLLNYEKEARVVFHAVCDNGKTTATLYEHESYDLDVIVTASGKTYLYFYDNNKYYVGSGSEAVEMEYETWDAELKLASPGYHALLHYGNHDCSRVK